MITTSFYKGNSYSKSDAYYEDQEHDDNLTACIDSVQVLFHKWQGIKRKR